MEAYFPRNVVDWNMTKSIPGLDDVEVLPGEAVHRARSNAVPQFILLRHTSKTVSTL